MTRAALLLAVVLSGCARASDSTPVFLTPYGTPTLPFSPAVRVGKTIYVSGQIGTDSAFRLVPGGIQAETRKTLENIRDILERSGSSMDRVAKCMVMVADMAEWPAMNEIYVTFFPRNRPARSSIGANGLALGARVEIECIATVP